MNWLTKWFKKSEVESQPTPKKIAFMDGDQNIPDLIQIYDKHLKGIETHFVRMGEAQYENRLLRNQPFNRIYIQGRAGKEVVDKFISGYIQKAICDGYTEITVVSTDYDFIDIFKMAVMINKNANDIAFRMIVPKNGLSNKLLMNSPKKIANISIIKEFNI